MTGWWRRLVDRLDERVTTRADARARELGFSVRRLPGTRTQVYRDDARWDRRRVCGECTGTGLDGARECPACDGWGVVTRDLSFEAGEQR